VIHGQAISGAFVPAVVDDTRPVPGILLRGDPGLDREIAAEVREFREGTVTRLV